MCIVFRFYFILSYECWSFFFFGVVLFPLQALWLHRRFLSQFGFKHFCISVEGYVKVYMDRFINGELELLHDCLTMSDNEFEDGQAQRVHAASYILWVSKVSLPLLYLNTVSCFENEISYVCFTHCTSNRPTLKWSTLEVSWGTWEIWKLYWTSYAQRRLSFGMIYRLCELCS